MSAIAAFMPVIQVVGAVIGAVNAIRQGQAAGAAAEYNAAVNRQNAEIAMRNARSEAAQQDRENYLRLGAIRAAQGRSGGTMEGSALDVLADTAAQGELERQNIMYRGALAARGFTNTAALDEFSGDNARTGGYLRAGSELLSGVAGAYATRERFRRSGGPAPRGTGWAEGAW